MRGGPRYGVLVALWQVVPVLAGAVAVAWMRPTSWVVTAALMGAAVIAAVLVAVGAELLRVRSAPVPGLHEHDGIEEPALGARGDIPSRSGLIEACIEVADVVPSEALRQKLHAGLASAGITSYSVDGVPFDPALHHGVGTLGTSDQNLVGLIAETERVGYRDADGVVRAPDVIVYKDSSA